MPLQRTLLRVAIPYVLAHTASVAAAQDAEAEATCTQGIQGVVADGTSGETLIEAPVAVVGRRERALTDHDGHFVIALPPGEYAIRSYYDLYQPAQLERIQVRAGECTDVHLDLDSTASDGEEVVIEVQADTGSEATALRGRRESASVQDGISAEEIRRSPDSDAGQSARRIVGASVVGGQYLFVRGLGGRYASVLLNGAALPSSDPDQPGVQLDLFPTSMLDGLVVSKTFTPDLPGDAAGGTMLISTREFPSHFQLSIHGSLGFNTETSFATAQTGPAGALDWLGFDDGRRALPSSVPQNTTLQSLSRDERIEATRGFRPRFGLRNTMAAPAGRLGIQFGDTVHLGDRRLGYFVSLGYSNATQILRDELIRPGASVVGQDQEGHLIFGSPEAQRRTSFTNNVSWGGLGAMRLELAEHDDLQLTVMASQNSESYTGVGRGYDFESDQQIEATRTRWLERNLFFGQLAGTHGGLPFGARLRWSLSGSMSGRSEPDIRDMIYGANVGSDVRTYRPSTSGSGERFFLNLAQREVGGTVDFSIPIDTLTFRMGGALRINERDFLFRRVRYEGTGGDADSLPATELFDPSRNGTSYELVERTDRTDGYHASQTLSAGFAMIDWPIVPWLRVVGGARMEAFRQTVSSGSAIFPSDGADQSRDTHRTDLDVLGSAGLIFRLSDEVFVRANYGTTVARPQIRELASFVFPDFIRQRTITGRPDLVRTRIHNFDLRAEWFLSPTEVIAISGFAKQFEDPIEITAEANNQFSYRNFQGALIAGVEAEARLSFARISPDLRFFDIAANVALVHSEIQLGASQFTTVTNQSRPLSGQSPYVVNVSLGVQLPDTGWTIRALYNVFGPRLIEVGIQGVPDVYQESFHSFDVTATWTFDPHFDLRVAVENVFLDDFLITQGGQVLQQYNQGLTANLGLSWRPE